MSPADLETAKTIGELGGMAAAFVLGVLRIGAWISNVNKELKWQSETLTKMARKGGTMPPPREKLMTLDDLDDPFPDILIESKKKARLPLNR